MQLFRHICDGLLHFHDGTANRQGQNIVSRLSCSSTSLLRVQQHASSDAHALGQKAQASWQQLVGSPSSQAAAHP